MGPAAAVRFRDRRWDRRRESGVSKTAELFADNRARSPSAHWRKALAVPGAVGRTDAVAAAANDAADSAEAVVPAEIVEEERLVGPGGRGYDQQLPHTERWPCLRQLKLRRVAAQAA